MFRLLRKAPLLYSLCCLMICLFTCNHEALADVVNETTCNSAKGGTIIVGKTSGTFCKSNKFMNWWSAYTWCQKLGLKMATPETACPTLTISGSTRSGDCADLNAPYKNSADSGTTISSGYVWLSRAWGSSYALYVNLSSGAVLYSNRSNPNYYALCESD